MWVETLGDGVGNHEHLPFLFQQSDQALLFGYQCVDLGGFAVEEGGDGELLLSIRNWLL